jgi:hypothetical protein
MLWSLVTNDTIHFSISMSLKLKEKTQMSPSFDNLVEEDLGVVGLDMLLLTS